MPNCFQSEISNESRESTSRRPASPRVPERPRRERYPQARSEGILHPGSSELGGSRKPTSAERDVAKEDRRFEAQHPELRATGSAHEEHLERVGNEVRNRVRAKVLDVRLRAAVSGGAGEELHTGETRAAAPERSHEVILMSVTAGVP